MLFINEKEFVERTSGRCMPLCHLPLGKLIRNIWWYYCKESSPVIFILNTFMSMYLQSNSVFTYYSSMELSWVLIYLYRRKAHKVMIINQHHDNTNILLTFYIFILQFLHLPSLFLLSLLVFINHDPHWYLILGFCAWFVERCQICTCAQICSLQSSMCFLLFV